MSDAPLIAASNWRDWWLAGGVGGDRPRIRWALILAGGLWLAAACAGMWWLDRYASTPGVAATAPDRWPAASTLERAAGRATLVVFAHPHCPCSRASVEELARLMAQVPGAAVDTYVLFLLPDGQSDGWERTDLWQNAAAIPGVHVLADHGGRQSAPFGAATSGQTLLYDAAGGLVFNGGITAARGHAGDNGGRTALAEWLTAGRSDRSASAVFGCPLGDAEPRPCDSAAGPL